MSSTKQYLKRFFEEKEIENKFYEIKGKNGMMHLFDNETLIDRIMHTSDKEQTQIAKILRKIDFKNGSVQHFLNYLAHAMVKQYAG